MINADKKYRLISKERLFRAKRNTCFSRGTYIFLWRAVTMYDGTFKCKEIPEYWLPSYLLEEIPNNSQSAPSVSNNQNSKIKRHMA